MEDLESIFNYQERAEELRQKLVDATLELESMKNVKTELFNLLKMAYQERDEARDQLQKLTNELVLSSPTHLQNVFAEVLQPESLVMLPTAKANSSITESNSLSQGSPHVDSFFEAVSRPEFSNIDVFDSNNMGYPNQPFVQDFNCSAYPALVSSEKPTSDPATPVIDCLAKGRALPQKGKLLQAVMDAGPLLQTVLLAGPLPTWRNPPQLQHIKVPPFTLKNYDTPSIELNSFADTGNSFLNPKLPSSRSSNALPTCSASVLNFVGLPSGSWSNAWQLTQNASVSIQIPSRKRQRLH